MRRLALVLALTVLAAPAVAEIPKNAVPLGGTLCKPAFPCAGLTDGTITNETLESKATACIKSGFNLSIQGGYFEKGLGLDSDGCLRTKKFPSLAQALSVTPVCCVEHLNETTCQMNCRAIGLR